MAVSNWFLYIGDTEINYSASIGHYHADNGGKPGADDNVSREYISKETLEENR